MKKVNWKNETEVLKEIDTFIKNNGGLLINCRGKDRWYNIIKYCKKYNYNIDDLCARLGYDYANFKKVRSPRGYYSNYENVKCSINEFINKRGYFPTLKELNYDLHISSYMIKKHGGINKIKDDMHYIGNDLIDDSGFRNHSHYEYIIAQFLLHNNISYLREQHPFPVPYNNYRSDFTFKTKNEEIIHLEVWGYTDKDKSKIAKKYNKIKNQKIQLYKKYNIKFISIEPSLFSNTLDDLQLNLKDMLSEILDSKLNIVNNDLLVYPYKMSDKELFDEIMKLSKDGINLPIKKDFSQNNISLLYEVLKRFGNYSNFAKKFNALLNKKYNFWSEDFVYDRLSKIHEKYGYLPSTSEIKLNKLAKDDYLFIGIIDGIKTVFGNITNGYLSFYERCKTDNISLTDNDIQYLLNIQHFKKKYITENDRQRAYDILCA